MKFKKPQSTKTTVISILKSMNHTSSWINRYTNCFKLRRGSLLNNILNNDYYNNNSSCFLPPIYITTISY